MIIPCEVAVKSIIPAVKALMAKELVEEHGLTQNEVAEILGISQSAVSKYSHKVRGYVVRIDSVDEVQPLINDMINLLMGETHQRSEFLELFCETCIAIRKTNLMCKFCQKSEPTIEVQECGFCGSLQSRPKRR